MKPSERRALKELQEREKELLERVGAMAGEELDHYCRELYEKIMEISRNYQEDYFSKENK